MNFKFRIKPKLIDKYIFKQVFLTSVVGMTLFTVIWISPEILFKVIKQVISHNYTIFEGLKVLILEVPMVLGKAIPMGLLLGSLWVFDKMSKDFELTTFRSVGVSLKRLLLPVIVISFLFSVLCFITFDKLIPISRRILFDMKGGVFSSQFVYLDKDSNNKPNQVIIVSKFDGNNIYNVTVLNLARENKIDAPIMSNIYTAPFSIYNKESWYLVDGMDYNISSDNVYKDIKHFDAIKILSGQKAKNAYDLMKYSLRRSRQYTNQELLNYILLLKKEDMTEEYRFQLNKFFQRVFQAISCIFLAICGCLLGYNRPRETRLIGFTAAVGVIFGYYIIVPLLELLAQKAILTPFIAASVPTLIVIGTIITTINLKKMSLK